MDNYTCSYCNKECDPIYHVVVTGSEYKRCYDSKVIADMERLI